MRKPPSLNDIIESTPPLGLFGNDDDARFKEGA